MASTMSSLPAYSYNPKRLVESFRELQVKERQKVVAATTTTTTTTTTATSHLSSSTTIQENSTLSHHPETDAIRVAAIQFTASGLPPNDCQGFWDQAQKAVIEAAEKLGAQLILLPELFATPYFCQSQQACLMELASPIEDSIYIPRMQQLAKQYQVVLPISIYERRNHALYNSIVMIDSDGSILGTYRKSHIPDGTGYQEKFYFTPGDTGFQVWTTKLGMTIGVAICWDQWFPEAARAMALQGADILLYPTAIGSEPQYPTIDSADHWQRAMQGHAAANVRIYQYLG